MLPFHHRRPSGLVGAKGPWAREGRAHSLLGSRWELRDLVTISSHRALCKQDSQAQGGEGTFHRSLELFEPGWSKEPVIKTLQQHQEAGQT